MKTKRRSQTPNSRIALRIEHCTEKNVEWLLGYLNRLPRPIARKIESLTLAGRGLGFAWRKAPTPVEVLQAEAVLADCLDREQPDGLGRDSM